MNNRITILYLIDTYVSPPGESAAGGAEKQLSLLATSLDPSLFRPIIVQLTANDSLPIKNGHIGIARTFHLPTKKFYSFHGLNQIRKLVNLAKDEQVNIIHTFFEKSEVMGWLVKRLAGIPVWVTSRRDLGFKRKEIYDRIFRLSSRDCNKCVENCNAVKEQTLQKERLPEEKIEVIYNGMDFSPYQKSDNENALRKEIGIDNQTFLVGMIANFNFEIKGHQFFIEAAKRVSEQVPNVEFLLVGDGALRQRFEKLSEELGVRQKIHFLGKRSDIPVILSSLNISVLCSTNEGFSNVILESMAAGKPVVATYIGGNTELVSDGVTGYIVPPSDSMALAHAILVLLREPDRAKIMGRSAIAKVQNSFTMAAMVERYERLYQSLL